MSPESLNSTIHLYCVRKECCKTNRIKEFLRPIFPLIGCTNSPPTSHACFNVYLNLVDYTTLSAMFSQWKKSSIAISSWVLLLLLMSLDMAQSKPFRIGNCPLFIDGHDNGGLLEATNAWTRELCKSCTDWAESSWTRFFPTSWEFLLSKMSW